MSQSTLQKTSQLMKRLDYLGAHRLLTEALETRPNDCELLIELGIASCYLGQEERGAQLLLQAGNVGRAEILGAIVGNYFSCRKLMAAKLGIPDRKAVSMDADVRRVCSLPDPNRGITLGASLIVRNEGANLNRCLSSVYSLVDEIVVVDTGSTDNTIPIAESFGAKIGNFEWCNDFSAARNAALELASTDWILWIDADEELTPESFDQIRQGLVRHHFGGYTIGIVNFTEDGSDVSQYTHAPVRLFQCHPEIRFEGRVHEQISPSIRKLGLPGATLDQAKILHHGYRPSELEAKDKTNRTIELLEREVREDPRDGFQWFNLANVFIIDGRHVDAEHAARMAIKFLSKDDQVIQQSYQILASTLQHQGRLEESILVCDEADAHEAGGILIDFERANALHPLGRLDEALAAIDRCLAYDWQLGMTGDQSIYAYKRHVVKGQILSLLGRHDEALEWLNEALSVHTTYAHALYLKATTLERMGSLSDAASDYRAATSDPKLRTHALKGIARIHRIEGRIQQAATLFKEIWDTDPSDQDAWAAWVTCAEQTGDPAVVLEAYASYARSHTPSSEILVNWGRALAENGHPEKAIECFTQAIAFEPTNYNAYFNAGDLLYKLGQYQDAALLYESGLRVAPEHVEAWFVLGNAMAQLSLTPGAVTAYKQALALAPNHEGAKQNLKLVLGQKAG